MLYRGDESDNPYTTDMNKYPGVVPCSKTTRVNSQSEDPGSLPADTDGSSPTISKPGGEYVVRTRSPSSHYPYPSLETVGNDRAHEGATAHQNTPHSRLHSVLVGGVWSMARPVSAHVSMVGGCPVFGRLDSGGIGYGTSGYHVQLGRPQNAKCSDGLHESFALVNAEYTVPSLRGPTCSARTQYTPAGEEVAFEVALDGPTWFGRPVSRHHETASPFRTTPRRNLRV